MNELYNRRNKWNIETIREKFFFSKRKSGLLWKMFSHMSSVEKVLYNQQTNIAFLRTCILWGSVMFIVIHLSCVRCCAEIKTVKANQVKAVTRVLLVN